MVVAMSTTPKHLKKGRIMICQLRIIPL